MHKFNQWLINHLRQKHVNTELYMILNNSMALNLIR